VEPLIATPEVAGGKFPWFALQVWSRKEPMIAAQLEGQGFECFLPRFTTVRRWSDRTKELEQPLFPGYLFCRFDIENRRSLVMCPGVVQILGFGRKPMPLEDREVEAIRQAVCSGLPRQPWPYLEVGERVRVDQGSLSGLEGILVSLKGHHRVILSITLLQRSIALEIDLAWVTPLRQRDSVKTQKKVACSGIDVPAIG
jgi:transcription antitermination factor NusG